MTITACFTAADDCQPLVGWREDATGEVVCETTKRAAAQLYAARNWAQRREF